MSLVPMFPSLKVIGNTTVSYGYFIFSNGSKSQLIHSKEGGEGELLDALTRKLVTTRQAEYLLERLRESDLPSLHEHTEKVLAILDDPLLLDTLCAKRKRDVFH